MTRGCSVEIPPGRVPGGRVLALDADVILAAQAALLAGPGDSVIVATTNPAHRNRYVTARDWRAVT